MFYRNFNEVFFEKSLDRRKTKKHCVYPNIYTGSFRLSILKTFKRKYINIVTSSCFSLAELEKRKSCKKQVETTKAKMGLLVVLATTESRTFHNPESRQKLSVQDFVTIIFQRSLCILIVGELILAKSHWQQF